MTLDSTTSKVQYTQSGTTTAWPVPYKFLDNEDLIVITTVDDVDTTLVLNTDYTVAGAGDDDGGTVTISPAVATGTRVTIYREIDLDQPTELTTAGGWFPKVHEAVFDRLTMIDQQLQEQLDRAVKLAPSTTLDPDTVAEELFEARDDAQTAASEAEASAIRAEIASSTVAYYSHEGTLTAGQDTITLPWAYDTSVGVEVYLAGVKQTESSLTFTDAYTVTLDTPVGADTAFEVVASAGAKGDLAKPSGSGGVGFIADGVGASARPVQAKLRDFVSVKDFGAVGDGVTDDTVAIQSSIDAIGGAGGGVVWFPIGTYIISSPLLVWSDTSVVGAGIGATTMKHASSHCFKNKNYTTTGDSNISIKRFTLDACGTADGGVSMIGISGLKVCENEFKNTNPDNVTVGVGVGATSTANSYDIEVYNNTFDVADYGVVCDSSEDGVIERIRIYSNTFRTAWGSCVSLAKKVSGVSITGNHFHMPGDAVSGEMSAPGVGIGVKMWQGIDVDNAPEDVSITANVFIGATIRDAIRAISAGNWTNNISIVGNTFQHCSQAFHNNFSGAGANNITFSNNVVKNCDSGYYNDNSSDVRPVIIGNQFESCDIGIRSSLNHAVVSGNRFANISQKALYANTATEGAQISGNTFWNIGEEAIFMSTGGSSNELCSITGNVFENVCTALDNTYSVIKLNDQSHIVSCNLIRNASTTIKPTYLIGGVGNHRSIVGNFFYGARLGYREVAGANDVYANNIERGGIG